MTIGQVWGINSTYEGSTLGEGWTPIIIIGFRKVGKRKSTKLETDLIALRDTLPRVQSSLGGNKRISRTLSFEDCMWVIYTNPGVG